MNNGSLTFEQMKEILQGMIINQKETDKRVAEMKADSERQLTEIKAESEKQLAEIKADSEKQLAEIKADSEKQRKETDKHLADLKAETERLHAEAERLRSEAEALRIENEKKRAEMDKRIEESNKKADKLWGKISSMWGQLVESLVEGDLIRILNERNIPVRETSKRRKLRKEGFNYEVDIIVHDGPILVIVEVKTTLRTDDIRDFLKVMEQIKTLLPEYHDKIIYGAMAFIQVDSNCDIMLERNGLLCIKATGDSAAITNPLDFIPKAWNN